MEQRLLAGPGEKIFCKLSVIARALFHISALPPYHHVYNVDKSSRRTEDQPIYPGTKAGSKSKTAPPIPPSPHEKTVTYPPDFYPLATGQSADDFGVALDRPRMLGVMLEPRLDSPINDYNREEWDYVLRKCFVTEAQALRVGLKNLAFGGEGLLDKIASQGDIFKGKPVSGDRIVRDMSVEEWARVVDVFCRWAFKPEVRFSSRPPQDACSFLLSRRDKIGILTTRQNLILDTRPDALEQRQIGTD